MNDKNFIEELKQKREEYGVTQTRLAVACGISREHYNRIEKGKLPLTDELKETIQKQIERFNPRELLFLLIDYFRVRFPTTDALAIICDLLKLNPDYMLLEDYGKYGYESQYIIGAINVMCSVQEHLGVLLELKGRGCRQMESYLLAQERSWYDFMLDCMTSGGKMKRLDLAVNDRAGILDIPMLKAKYKAGGCISFFRKQKDYSGTDKCGNDIPQNTGETLYLGSTSSELYMCAYQKNYEQYVKNGTEIEDTEIKNRFEIRMKNERAYYAVVDLLTYRDAERTTFSIINHYVRFVDREDDNVIDEYIDDGWSGTNFERPSFQRMIEDIETGKINCVVTKDLSRLGRNYIMTGQYTELYFPSHNVRYIAIDDGVDSEKGESEIAPFKNIINEWVARDTSRKVKSAFKTKFAEGAHYGAYAPLGYKKHPDIKGKLLIDDETKWIVEKIFSLAYQGYGSAKHHKDTARGKSSDSVMAEFYKVWYS